MSEEPIIKDLRRRMDGALEVLRKEFAGLRTGRASASLLEPVVVEAYGNTMPLAQVGTHPFKGVAYYNDGDDPQYYGHREG